MATKVIGKRPETIFPGSQSWVDVGNKGSDQDPDEEDKKRHKSQIPRIKLPVKPLTAYPIQQVPILEGSPWKHYKKAFRLELGGPIAVVHTVPATKELFVLHSFSGPDRERRLYMLRQFDHPNLLLSKEIYSFEESFYVISEYAAISLEEFIIARPDETQLVTMIHQILNSITYLHAQHFVHGALSCSNILVTIRGCIKIASLDNCFALTEENRLDDVKALGRVMNTLMEPGAQPDTPKNGRITSTLNLKDPSRWSAEVVDFLSLTTDASVSELAQHPFLQRPTLMYELVPLVALAQVSACRFYSINSDT